MFTIRDPSKAVQVGFLLLLALTSAQVAWWTGESVHYARQVKQRLESLYYADASAINALRENASPDELSTLLPHLAIKHGAKTVVRRDLLDALEGETARRINRYLWEGGFFLFVLISGMSVLTGTIRHDAGLRRRQQNFLAAVSHEFKSPLASIRLSAETLVMRSKDSESERLGRRIIEDNERLLRMVDNLLETTRIEEGRYLLKAQAISMRQLASTGIEAFQERASAANIEISLDCDSSLGLMADLTAVETILRNLLDNAVKSCIASHGRKITVSVTQSNRQLVLEVRDEGMGFPPAEAAMMFRKFYRVGDELRRSTSGTGLGLYIVKRLAENSGASVSATSDGDGRGATVTVAWPESYLQ